MTILYGAVAYREDRLQDYEAEIASWELVKDYDYSALAKFAIVGTLAYIATWLLADPLVRLPGVRRVV